MFDQYWSKPTGQNQLVKCKGTFNGSCLLRRLFVASGCWRTTTCLGAGGLPRVCVWIALYIYTPPGGGQGVQMEPGPALDWHELHLNIMGCLQTRLSRLERFHALGASFTVHQPAPGDATQAVKDQEEGTLTVCNARITNGGVDVSASTADAYRRSVVAAVNNKFQHFRLDPVTGAQAKRSETAAEWYRRVKDATLQMASGFFHLPPHQSASWINPRTGANDLYPGVLETHECFYVGHYLSLLTGWPSRSKWVVLEIDKTGGPEDQHLYVRTDFGYRVAHDGILTPAVVGGDNNHSTDTIKCGCVLLPRINIFREGVRSNFALLPDIFERHVDILVSTKAAVFTEAACKDTTQGTPANVEMTNLANVLTSTGLQIMVYISVVHSAAMVQLVRRHLLGRFHRIVYVLRQSPSTATDVAAAQDATIRGVQAMNHECGKVQPVQGRNGIRYPDPIDAKRAATSKEWDNTTHTAHMQKLKRMDETARASYLFFLQPKDHMEFQRVAAATPYEA